MKSVEALQEVQVLPRATARHQPGRNTRWREATNGRSRVEQGSRVGLEPRKVCESRGPARDHHPRTPAPWVWEPRTVAVRGNAVSALSLAASQGRGHRGRRPAHAGKGRARGRVSASAASCLDKRGAVQRQALGGASTACSTLPRQGPPPRRAEPSSKTRGRQGQRDKRERDGTVEGREAVCAAPRSEGLDGSPGQTRPRTPLGTASLGRRARRRRRCWAARAPTPSRGPGAAQATPGVLAAPRQDRATGLRARCPSRGAGNGALRRHRSLPPWRAPRSPSTGRWRCWNGR
jgi:hypothetical protein